MPATPDKLFALLDKLGIETTTSQHEAVFTVAESDRLHREITGGHTKNLFVKDKKDNYFLIVAEATAQIPINRVHPLIGAKSRVSFANADRLMEFLGVEPGSVTAFAPMNDHDNRVKVIIDAPLLRHDMLNCHPLKTTMTTTISRQNLLHFLEYVGHVPEIIDLSSGGDTAQRIQD
jgi:Ala-tRNA(Pro) deacylase